MTRWELPTVVLVASLLVSHGCGDGGAPAGSPSGRAGTAPARALRFGMTPFNELPVLYEESRAISAYLEKNLDRPVRVVMLPDYRSMRQILRQGRLDLAWITPALYIRSRGKVPYEPVCCTSRHGQRTHTGVIVVPSASPRRSLRDLVGAVFTYVDRQSTTGFILPNLLLEREGIDPLRAFKEVRYSRNHSAALEDLLAGACDAAAVHDGARTAAGTLDKLPVRILARSGRVPTDPVVVRSDLDPALRSRIRRLFLEMARHPLGSQTLERLGRCDAVDGFWPTRDEDYRLDGITAGEAGSSGR